MYSAIFCLYAGMALQQVNIKGWIKRFQGLHLRLEVMTWDYCTKGYDLHKYCFTTIYIIFLESEEMARRLGLRSYICSASASVPIQAIQPIQRLV